MSKKSLFTVLFPEVDVKLSNGSAVSMRPLPLSKLGSFTGAFVRIYEAALLTPDQSGIMERGVNEFLELFPFCCETPSDDIPASDVFALMRTFLEQNVTDETIKNFSALISQAMMIIQKVTKTLAGDQGTSPELDG